MLRISTIPRALGDWYRDVANAVNGLQKLQIKTVLKDGATLYTSPVISNPPTQAEVQALADAVEAISDRLK